MSKVDSLQKRLDNANIRLMEAYKKPSYNITDEKRVLKSIETWSNRVDELQSQILEEYEKDYY